MYVVVKKKYDTRIILSIVRTLRPYKKNEVKSLIQILIRNIEVLFSSSNNTITIEIKTLCSKTKTLEKRQTTVFTR